MFAVGFIVGVLATVAVTAGYFYYATAWLDR